MAGTSAIEKENSVAVEQQITNLLGEMTLEEKVGQMCQVDAGLHTLSADLPEEIRAGKIGSVINEVDVNLVNELQRIAVEESRMKIPLIVGRDVIHGFKTVMPIPLGQAATWNPDLVTACARSAALEAAAHGTKWTFAPMMDIARDPRWGRIAESLGEDTYLTGSLASAMVRGFQGDNFSDPGSIAACVKHFAGYGAVEGGRDYSATSIPENELRNTYLPPFKKTIEAGAMTVMTSFSDLDGIPATASEFLLRDILRDEWSFQGFVISDWDSISELCTHGFAANKKHAAYEAVIAGVSMEMAGDSYSSHVAELVENGEIDIKVIDEAVGYILGIKFQLGLFDDPYTDPEIFSTEDYEESLVLSKQAALESIVLLKNEGALPLDKESLNSIAVIGPLADDPYEQLGTWIFDGDQERSITCLQGIRDLIGDAAEIHHCQAMATTREKNVDFSAAVATANNSDAVLLVIGEESILSGEAHCRADISLPGDQAGLVHAVRQTGKPVIAVIMSGRPLTLDNILDHVDAVMFAWHPGTMGGAAIAELVFGIEVPSGKLPVTFPKHVGQVPIYYNHKRSGKPPVDELVVHIDNIEPKTPQTYLGMCTFHLDQGYRPQFVFGYGLSYTTFAYNHIECSETTVEVGQALEISAEITNTGDIEATEIAQLYIQDLVGNVTRPVRELKGFRKIILHPGETRRVTFELSTQDLAFYGRKKQLMIEPGDFKAWIGGDSDANLETAFTVVP